MTILIIDENNNKIISFSYLLESYDVWYDRLSHNTMQRLIKHELLPSMIFEKNHKCEICVKSKFSKLYFQIIKKVSKPLDLIHSDISDLKFVQTEGDKKDIILLL